MDYQDYYQLLGIKRDANADEIKKAYRRLARKYHPDVSKEDNAEEKFKEVKEAYEVLKDPAKRQAYDELGQQSSHAGFEPPPNWQYQQQDPQPQSDDFEHVNQADFSDFFSELFGQRGQGQPFKRPGQDQHSKIQISLQDAYHGATRQLQLQSIDNNGQPTTKTLNVKIPAGISTGQHIRLSGQGLVGGNGKAGDLYLEVEIAPDTFYTVEDKNIHCHLPITPWEAALGGKVNAPTLGGKVQINVPANSQSGAKMRLKGRGLPGKVAGDQYITLEIQTPKATQQEQRDLYEKMAQLMPFNPREHLV